LIESSSSLKGEVSLKSIFTITPSLLIKKKRDFTAGVKSLEKLGFKVLNKSPILKLPSTRRKVAQIHAAFLNKRAGIILAHRGGYGSMKLLPFLDFNLIRNHPKILAGFSDLSALLNVISERTGLVTLHSPMIINFSPPSRFTVHSFLNAVNGFPERNLFEEVPVKVHRKGIGRGRLKGGNLITLSALMGTEWEIDTDGAILFLEDVDEKLHKVDRYLTQWIFAGKLRKVKGLILGNFRGVQDRDVYNVISGQIKIDFPVVYCPYVGHVKNKITLPVGGRVELNTMKKALTLL
jgi:muramoyltetrapeptide carboxypeptidase